MYCYRSHALQRRAEMGLTDPEIRRTMDGGGISRRGKKPGETRVHGTADDGRGIIVVYDAHRDPAEIITILWQEVFVR